jgi:nitrate reductase cytochrome c-type subunit
MYMLWLRASITSSITSTIRDSIDLSVGATENKTKQNKAKAKKSKSNQNQNKTKKTRVIYKSGNEYPFVAHAIHEYRTDIIIQVGNLCVELLSSTFPMRGFLVNDGMISRYN